MGIRYLFTYIICKFINIVPFLQNIKIHFVIKIRVESSATCQQRKYTIKIHFQVFSGLTMTTSNLFPDATDLNMFVSVRMHSYQFNLTSCKQLHNLYIFFRQLNCKRVEIVSFCFYQCRNMMAYVLNDSIETISIFKFIII